MSVKAQTGVPCGSRDAGGGRAGGYVPPPQVLGYQLTLFGPRRADYARHITTCPPPAPPPPASLPILSRGLKQEDLVIFNY